MEKVFINLSLLRKEMKDKPIGQRLWLFFKGYANNLSKAQCKEIKTILEKKHKETIAYIDKLSVQCTD